MIERNSEKLRIVLREIATLVLEQKEMYPNNAIIKSAYELRNIMIIFHIFTMDMITALCEKEKHSKKDLSLMLIDFTKELKKLIKIYTNIDLYDMMEQNINPINLGLLTGNEKKVLKDFTLFLKEYKKVDIYDKEIEPLIKIFENKNI